MQFEAENRAFEAGRQKWIAEGHLRHWVVILDDKVIGFFPDVGSAYSAGVSQLGTARPFLVREITEHDEPEILRRVWAPLHG